MSIVKQIEIEENNNFIFKLIDLAKGFSIKERPSHHTWTVSFNNYSLFDCHKDYIGHMMRESLEFPLLLTRAVYGFNEKYGKDDYKYICIESDCINYSLSENINWRKGLDGSINHFFIDTNIRDTVLTVEEQSLEEVLKDILL